MTSDSGFASSSIGKKYLMGITGLGLSVFVLIHMLGNCLIFLGSDAYNTYSHAIISSKALLYGAEAGLILFFLVHIFLAISLTRANRAARPERYALTTHGKKGVSLASRTMIHHGMVILVFTILHLITFKYGPYYETTVNDVVMRDLFRLMAEVFQNPGYVAWYVVALFFLGFHLSHGVQSSLQSLGLNHPRYTPMVKKVGAIFAWGVAIGFISQPLYLFLFWNN